MRRLTSILLCFALTACAQQQRLVETDFGAAPAPGPSDPNILLADEIATVPAISAYDAIQKLRANFLASRGAVTMRNGNSPLPVVFIDGSLYGDLGTLKNIQASNVEKIQMYRAWESSTKFGGQYTAGVIAVSLKK